MSIALTTILLVLTISAFLLFYLKQFKQLKAYREENEQLKKALHESMRLDDVTGAYNYAFFVKMSNIQIKQARRRKWPMSLLVVDIDALEKINVRKSFAIGNTVLEHLYKSITSCVRESDIVGRFGGSGFFILLSDCAEKDLPNIISHIRRCIEDSSCQINGKPLAYDIHCGGVTMHGVHIYLNTMLTIAENALDSAKNRGVVYAIADHNGVIVKTGELDKLKE
ncbi:GGDEF domain-containing protein [Hydrogenimonas cancrithermarum]|uniref:diguanylate cyclase n=1 Tax=Hydrogenimonas cancrithermarum TaxID=2993563 RepID=A0ABM8FID9_9BACT|nr:GGDEF domain-containing protein [Hydrogenimonas cancrithermarum]BDY12051.1 hypothetical protein HCR_03630 [Hydrogenimonas cancrithermarum]